MREEEFKKYIDKIYNIGLKNGGIEMKNKILKKINRDYSLVCIKNPIDLIVKILKVINKVK